MHAEAPQPGDQIEWSASQFMEIVEVAEPTAHLVMGVEMFGTDLRALQVVHAQG
jgi:hypothetical protein